MGQIEDLKNEVAILGSQLANANSRRDVMRALYETASAELAKARSRIAEAINRVSDLVIYSANTVDALRGEKQRTEAEVDIDRATKAPPKGV